MSKYTQLKSDPTFMYRAIKICDDCYDSVKLMLEYKDNNEGKVASVKNVNSNKSHGSKSQGQSNSESKNKTQEYSMP